MLYVYIYTYLSSIFAFEELRLQNIIQYVTFRSSRIIRSSAFSSESSTFLQKIAFMIAELVKNSRKATCIRCSEKTTLSLSDTTESLKRSFLLFFYMIIEARITRVILFRAAIHTIRRYRRAVCAIDLLPSCYKGSFYT